MWRYGETRYEGEWIGSNEGIDGMGNRVVSGSDRWIEWTIDGMGRDEIGNGMEDGLIELIEYGDEW